MLRAVKEGETFRGLARGMDPNAATCFCAKKFPFAGFRLLFFFFSPWGSLAGAARLWVTVP